MADAMVQFVNANPLDTFREVLEQQICSDVTLVCEDGLLRAHRPVLASASGFLKQLFMDVPDGHVTILMPEVRSQVMWKLLEFIYTGNTRASWNEVPDVTALSDLLMLGVDLASLNSLMEKEREAFQPPTVTAYSEPEVSAPSEILVIADPLDAPAVISEIASQHDLDMRNVSIWMDGEEAEVYVTDGQEVEVESKELQVAEVLATDEPEHEECVDVISSQKARSLSRRHICPTCGKMFPSRFSLEGHVRTHTGEKPFSCNYCERKFTFKSNWRQHELVHSSGGQTPKPGQKLMPCDLCHKKFRCWSAVVTHKRTHTGDRPFLCSLCGKGFAVKSNCKKHEQLHAAGKIDKPRDGKYSCPICSKMFKTPTYLRVHLKMHSSIRPYACRMCEKTFNFSSNLATHEKMHHGKVPSIPRSYGSKKKRDTEKTSDEGGPDKKKTRCFKCDVCGKRFFSKSNLLGHSRVHSEAKAYECKVCGKTFTYNSNCKKHEQLHKKWDENPSDKPKLENRVPCDICMKTFSPSHLRVHKRLHTGEKPYQCRFCVRAFTFSSNCSKHEKLHIQGRQVGKGRGMDEEECEDVPIELVERTEEIVEQTEIKVDEIHVIEAAGNLLIDLGQAQQAATVQITTSE